MIFPLPSQEGESVDPTGYLTRLSRLALIIAAATASFACGGGGGGAATDLHLSRSSVAFQALASDPASETVTVQITWSSSKVAGILIGTPPEQVLPAWLNVTAQ